MAYSIWLNHDPARSYMVMFTAYFDASGHPNDVGSTPALFVSGFVSTVEKWLKFEKYWLALLEEFHITPPFHMTDFESGHGQYAAWKDDREERERFRSEALHVIKRWTNKPFSSGVLIPDFQRLFREYAMAPEVPREPYPFCGEAVVVDLLRPWLEHCIKDGRFRMGTDNLQIVFEHGDKHKGLLEAALERRNVDAIFMKKAALVPFQACDFLAWMHRRWLTNFARLGGKNRPSKSLLEFTEMFPRDSSTFGNWEEFVRECEERGIKKREPAA